MRKIHLLLTFVAFLLATTNLSATPAFAVDGKLVCGAFTINAEGYQVYFSQGNLQYIGSAETPYWKFADEQYECLGKNGQGGTATNVDRDLFGWGTSGYHDPNDPTNTRYQPWSTANSGTNNQNNWWGYGPGINILSAGHSWSEVEATKNYDWGVYNTISNGLSDEWRTLTKYEWDYLLNTRDGATINNQQARWTRASVSGREGIILIPDNYNGGTPSGVTWASTFNSNTSYTSIQNLNAWRSLENAGCVFLVRAGDRYGTQVESVGTYGYYWTSTVSDIYTAACLHLTSNSNYGINVGISRHLGASVRLVSDVPSGETASASVTSAPTPVSNLTYTGSVQTLVTAGIAKNGTMKYRLGTSASYSASIPTATNAGDYIVQYMVEGTGCFNDFTPDDNTINVTIAKASFTPSPMKDVEAASLTYNGSPQDLLSVSGELQDGCEILYSKDGVNWSSTIPQETNAGDYTVYYKVVNEPNYEYIPSPDHIDVTISPADIVLPSISTDLIYTGSPQPLLDIIGIVGGTIYYSVDGNEPWLDVCPSETEIGTYDIWYKVVPDNSNYNSIPATKVTVTIDDPYPFVADNADPTTKLTELLNTPSDLKVKRTIYADDEYNTICLPFSLDASALAASPLAGFNRLKTFKGAQVTGTAPDFYIDIFVEDATTIEAGVPYLITYPSAHADIVNPVFTGITVSTTEPGNVEADGVTFQGMFAQVHIDPYDAGHAQDYLFVGANSQLYWPLSTQTSSDIKMRGFRAYFIIDRNSITPALAPKGTRARILDAPKTTTAIDNTSAKFSGSEKIIENGILYIIRNGVKYNAQGQIVK